MSVGDFPYSGDPPLWQVTIPSVLQDAMPAEVARLKRQLADLQLEMLRIPRKELLKVMGMSDDTSPGSRKMAEPGERVLVERPASHSGEV